MSISPRRPRTYRSAELRRQIAEETLAPGASASLVARAHNVNANPAFTWRRRYRQEPLQNSNSSKLRTSFPTSGNGTGTTPGGARKLLRDRGRGG
ncbi:MAG: transposase [Chitinophagaceae bacterium]|jgi:transposase-like protein|nr:transposase [Chitinophagaceae bacterium]